MDDQDCTIRIGLMGDVMIGRLVNEFLDHAPTEYLWGDLLPMLRNLDLRILNLEAALTHSNKAVPKVFNFKADPSKVKVLNAAAIDIVNLANNHILDYSEEGLLETLSTLDRSGIKHVGAGKNLSEAQKAEVVEIQGMRIGIVGYTDNEPSWCAGSQKLGVHYGDIGDVQKIDALIQKIRSRVDFLILSIHWGPNMRQRPPGHFVDFAHHLMDQGVDLIHGHSAHIFQGVELYRGKLILYDTGDFVDDYAVDPVLRNDLSFLFIVEAAKNGIRSLRMIPTQIADRQVNRAGKEAAQWSMARMKQLSYERNTLLEQRNDELVLLVEEKQSTT